MFGVWNAKRKVDASSTHAGWAGCPPYVSACAVMLVAGVTASTAQAADVPSGQPVTLHEVLVDKVGDDTWLRFRFIAPQIARKTGTVDYETAEPDMAHLCNTVALNYVQDYTLEGDVIVISLSDRKTEFGQPDPDATQFFEAYRPVDNVCMWEGL